MADYRIVSFRVDDVRSRAAWCPPLPTAAGEEISQFPTRLWTPPADVGVRPEFAGKELRLAFVPGRPESDDRGQDVPMRLGEDLYWWPQAVSADLFKDGLEMYRDQG